MKNNTVVKYLSKIRDLVSPSGWFKNYPTWEEAVKDSTGYDSNTILEKVKNAALLVKNGKGAFERDSVLFLKKEYNWPILSMLLRIATQQHLSLRILDFGGSLGSLYFQHKDFLEELEELKWGVIEQTNFVEVGKKFFEDSSLKFYLSIEDGINDIDPSVIILSSVLPYIEKPYDILNKILNFKPLYLIFDKMPFITGKDRITIQKVPPSIYKASYPSWFFNLDNFENLLSKEYQLIASYDCKVPCNIKAEFMGLFYIRKDQSNFG